MKSGMHRLLMRASGMPLVPILLLALGLGLALTQAGCSVVGVTRVTTASSSDRASHSPSLSDDGERVVFWSDADILGHFQSAGQDGLEGFAVFGTKDGQADSSFSGVLIDILDGMVVGDNRH